MSGNRAAGQNEVSSKMLGTELGCGEKCINAHNILFVMHVESITKIQVLQIIVTGSDPECCFVRFLFCTVLPYANCV